MAPRPRSPARPPAPRVPRADALPQAEQRRRAILEAALRVIGEGGVDAVTHRRLAAAAGVALGSTTYYFETREALVRAAFQHYAAHAFSLIREIGREVALRSPDDVVAFLVEVVRREFAADPALVRVEHELILHASRDAELARDVEAYERNLTAGLAETLEALGAEEAFEAARTLIALVRGFELERLVKPGLDVKLLERRLRRVTAAFVDPEESTREPPTRKRRNG